MGGEQCPRFMNWGRLGLSGGATTLLGPAKLVLSPTLSLVSGHTFLSNGTHTEGIVFIIFTRKDSFKDELAHS